MPSKWIHLYSIPKNERNFWNWKCSIKKKEIISLRDLLYGKSILSIALSPNDNPMSCVKRLDTYKEPPL